MNVKQTMAVLLVLLCALFCQDAHAFYNPQQAAGEVGGLVVVNAQPSTQSTAYDGNGNVAGLVNANDGTLTANYEYGPFGEVIRMTGLMALANPFRFSTKYQDNESDLLYYGYRFYNASQGRWLNRDPIGEESFLNKIADRKGWKEQERIVKESKLPCYLFLRNSPQAMIDPRGLSGLNTGKIWGNWCGGGWTAGKNMESTDYDWENDPSPDVIDSLDACCKKHDACWANWDLMTKKKLPGKPDTDKCDDLLCDCARANWSFSNKTANAGIQCAMCSRRNAADAKDAKCQCPLIKISFSF